MSINKIILISLLINLFIAQDSSQNHPDYYDELYCGKKNPKKVKDCTKYGTGSGMVCCWIGKDENTNGKCRLIPDETARQHGISGNKKFISSIADEQYWDCGNKSNFIFFNLVNILLFLILL